MKVISLLDWCLFTGLLSLTCLSGITPLGYFTAKVKRSFIRRLLIRQALFFVFFGIDYFERIK